MQNSNYHIFPQHMACNWIACQHRRYHHRKIRCLCVRGVLDDDGKDVVATVSPRTRCGATITPRYSSTTTAIAVAVAVADEFHVNFAAILEPNVVPYRSKQGLRRASAHTLTHTHMLTNACTDRSIPGRVEHHRYITPSGIRACGGGQMGLV